MLVYFNKSLVGWGHAPTVSPLRGDSYARAFGDGEGMPSPYKDKSSFSNNTYY